MLPVLATLTVNENKMESTEEVSMSLSDVILRAV